MRFVTVYFQSGKTICTSINGTVQEIIKYYFLKLFELDECKPLELCVALAIEEPK